MGMADDDYLRQGAVYDYLRSLPTTGPLAEALNEPTPPPTLGQRVLQHMPGMSYIAAGLNSPEGQIMSALYAPGRIKPAIAKGRLFDTSPKVLERVPNVPQVDYPEPSWARGTPQWMIDQGLDKAPNMRRLGDLVDKGIESGAGLGWYNTEQLLQRFQAELGKEKGLERYQDYMQMVAATSPENKVHLNTRDASYRLGLMVQGEEPPTKEFKPAPGYGSKVQQLHNQNVANVMTGGLDPLQNPKVFRFGENLAGNWTPPTLDRHALRAVGVETQGGQPMESPKTAYSYVGDIFRRLAERKGITPAQVQSSMWIGAGDQTGLKSAPDPFLKVFEDRVKYTAEKRGLTPEVVMRRMMRGEEPLLGLAGAGLALAPLGVPALPGANSEQ